MDAAHNDNVNANVDVADLIDALINICKGQGLAYQANGLERIPALRSKYKRMLHEIVGLTALKTCLAALPACTAEQSLKIANDLLAPKGQLTTRSINARLGTTKPRPPSRAKRAQPQTDNPININSLEP